MNDKALALIELAQRCEAATGPNLTIDETIADLMGISVGTLTPRYTASLDAATTLVPDDENHFPTVAKFFNGRWEGRCYEQFSGERNQAIAATPALAICAASLRARANG